MDNNQPESRSFLKRHSEALLIIAFILADCFASGWVLTAGTVAAVLWVVVPALRSMWTMAPADRITFLKAYAKTQRVQRMALLLFWIYSIRLLVYATTKSLLFTVGGGHAPTLSSALFIGAQEFAPLLFLATPLLIYGVAAALSIGMRAVLKSTPEDPDLIKQRQTWYGVSHFLLFTSFVGSILTLTLHQNGPAFMVSNWLLASTRDANIFNPNDFKPGEALGLVQSFDHLVITVVSLSLFLLLLNPVLKLNAFLSSCCWRIVSPSSVQNIVEGFLEALRLPSRTLTFREAHPLRNNAVRTVVWLFCCYGVLFWLFGFSNGPLSWAIENWMLASAVDAGFQQANGLPKWMFEPSYRIFIGAVVALYGTAPLAVTAATFLPYAGARKIVINSDGISFSQGPFIPLLGRQFRLWSDVKSLSVEVKHSKHGAKAVFTLEFRTGGRIYFNDAQMTPQDLKVFLEAIDQYAGSCFVDPQVYEVCRSLLDKHRDTATSDGEPDTALTKISAEEFKSTIFVPFITGDFISGTKTRVIKQLASKPLCAVYLARTEDGRMVTVKQFYLADESDETKALAKILKREYDLLSNLDHPGIAKVINSFTHENSTFLVIEHRLGSDLRAIVKEHGPRSENITINWAKQLCEIMMYLHSREPAITHRDLTPDNIIVGSDGQLRLIDFGAAREFLDGITGTMIGKHCYVAPEQLRGEADTKSDIYSFGATLYYLLTGRDPKALSKSAPSNFVDCSGELDKLIQLCTEFDEEHRPKSFEDILKSLNEIDTGFKIRIPAKEKVSA